MLVLDRKSINAFERRQDLQDETAMRRNKRSLSRVPRECGYVTQLAGGSPTPQVMIRQLSYVVGSIPPG
jgi:hypothetical protein